MANALKWIVAEAKKIKRKYPHRFKKWTDYVAQASAIYASKHKGRSPVGKKRAHTKKRVRRVRRVRRRVGLLKKGHRVKIIPSGAPRYGIPKPHVSGQLQPVVNGRIGTHSTFTKINRRRKIDELRQAVNYWEYESKRFNDALRNYPPTTAENRKMQSKLMKKWRLINKTLHRKHRELSKQLKLLK